MIQFLAGLTRIALVTSAIAPTPSAQQATTSLQACKIIAQQVSSATKVYYPGSEQYEADNHHFVPAASDISACSVEPATAQDVGVVLKVVGEHRTPFGVKSGGHAPNPHHSSTSGVQISLSQFNSTTYNRKTRTAVIGSGQPWTEVYRALAPHNVSVPGVRQKLVGVGGFLLGGGFSHGTSQYGLGLDSVLAFELVKPDGSVVNVSAKKNPDLFFGLKGTHNNLGIVTKFTVRTYSRGLVYAGNIVYPESQFEPISQAIAHWDATNVDPKAVVFGIYQHTRTDGASVYINLMYDGPTPPKGLFDRFLNLPTISNTVGTRTHLSFVEETTFPFSLRSVWDHVPVERYPIDLLHDFAKESYNTVALLNQTSWEYVFYVFEPYVHDYLHRVEPLHGFPTPSAWPPQRKVALMPSLIWVGWNDTKDSQLVEGVIRPSTLRLQQKAASLGQAAAAPGSANSSRYPNYSSYWTTAEDIFGKNLPWLRRIKKRHDPHDVMGLAGGFKL